MTENRMISIAYAKLNSYDFGAVGSAVDTYQVEATLYFRFGTNVETIERNLKKIKNIETAVSQEPSYYLAQLIGTQPLDTNVKKRLMKMYPFILDVFEYPKTEK